MEKEETEELIESLGISIPLPEGRIKGDLRFSPFEFTPIYHCSLFSSQEQYKIFLPDGFVPNTIVWKFIYTSAKSMP